MCVCMCVCGIGTACDFMIVFHQFPDFCPFISAWTTIFLSISQLCYSEWMLATCEWVRSFPYVFCRVSENAMDAVQGCVGVCD